MAILNPVTRRFARRLRQFRAAAGLTQAALAERAQLAQPYLSQLERGIREPSIVTVVHLAKALGVKPGTLLE